MVFVPNPNLARDLEQDNRDGLLRAAEPVRQIAEVNVRSAGGPWVPNKDGRQPVEIVEDDDGVHVVLTDHAGHLMEWGHRYYGPQAPLRRAAMSAGLKVQETDKT